MSAIKNTSVSYSPPGSQAATWVVLGIGAVVLLIGLLGVFDFVRRHIEGFIAAREASLENIWVEQAEAERVARLEERYFGINPEKARVPTILRRVKSLFCRGSLQPDTQMVATTFTKDRNRALLRRDAELSVSHLEVRSSYLNSLVLSLMCTPCSPRFMWNLRESPL